MTQMAPEIAAVIGLVIAAAVLAVLHTLAAGVRDQTRIHQTQVKAARLRAQFKKRLAEQEGIIVVDEAPPEVVELRPIA